MEGQFNIQLINFVVLVGELYLILWHYSVASLCCHYKEYSYE